MSSARQVALDILGNLSRGDKTLDYWMDQADPAIRGLNRADRAFVHALVFGTVRWRGRLDHIIDQLARKPAKIDPLIRHLLQMALFQMFHMQRIPHSAAVHTAVELAKKNGHKWAAGFVNGVLRRIAADPGVINWPERDQRPHIALATEQSFPAWLTHRWIERFGFDETKRLCEAINCIPAITIRTNTLKTDRNGLMESIKDETETAQATQYAPEGIRLRSLARKLTQWPSYGDGWFQVQDEAAQLVSHLVAPAPGESIWDACAGLGTKSAHLAQIMEDRGTVVASDLQPSKLERLTTEMQRLGITAVVPHTLDLTGVETEKKWPHFDKILVDSPCSGLGVLQKNPDGKWRLTEEEIVRSAKRQSAILDRVAAHLRVGGTLIYAVCSFEPEENENVVEGFLQKHPEFAIDIPQMATASKANRLITPEGFLRTFPHKNSMDGFFAARLIRRS